MIKKEHLKKIEIVHYGFKNTNLSRAIESADEAKVRELISECYTLDEEETFGDILKQIGRDALDLKLSEDFELSAEEQSRIFHATKGQLDILGVDYSDLFGYSSDE